MFMLSSYSSLLAAAKLLLLSYLLSSSLSGHTQTESSFVKYQLRKSTTVADSSGNTGNDNRNLLPAKSSIRRVDSISRTAGIPGHFARIYSKVMANIELQIRDADTAAAFFIQKFEIHFADYFLNACTDDKNGKLSSSEWSNLFSNPAAHPLQLTLMGINAHTNGDIWQALVNNFPEKDIRLHKKAFLACQASIVKVLYPFYDSIAAQSWYLKFMKTVTMGLVKNLGERIIYKWRLRQVNLAILYYHDPEKFNKRLLKINRKKEKIDQLILHRLSLILPLNSS
jgi:hypothetical protein